MILKLEQNNTQNDIEVIVKYREKSKTVERIISFINSVDLQIPCLSDDIVELINAYEIYFVESIDNKTIIHCEKYNYLVKERLYQIYEKLKKAGFIQINKYCIININKLVKIKQLANSHLEAVLKNGIYLCVTRKYLTEIKQILREMC